MVAADLGREGAAVANRQGSGEEVARAEQEELTPSLAAGRSPRALPRDDIPYNGASAIALASEHAPLPSPHERTASLSRFIQCRRRGCFLQIYISTNGTPAKDENGRKRSKTDLRYRKTKTVGSEYFYI
jgi:hypothetical protein